MLEPKTSSADGPPGCPRASSSSYAERPLPGQRVRVDAPDAGDVLARGRVVDHPVAGQLVGLLAVLAPALAVALPGEAAVAGARRARHPEREGHVDPGEHGVGAGAVLLGAAGGQHHDLGACRPSRSASARTSSAGTPVTRSTRSGHQPATDSRTSAQPVVRVATYSSSTVPPRDEQVQHAEGQGEVGPRDRLHEDVGAVRGRRTPRVDDHDLPAALPERVEVARGRRHGLGQVGADEDDDVGLLDVGQRERQPPVQAEGPRPGRRGRRHAPAAVVVDLRGAERDPGELAELVGLLVGQPSPAEDRDRVGAPLRAQRGEAAGDQVERLVPATPG